MLRVNAFLVVLLALSSLNGQAGLLHRPWRKVQHHAVKDHALAEKLYKEAFAASFTNHWQEASKASERAALLDHGTKRWSYEARDFVHHH